MTLYRDERPIPSNVLLDRATRIEDQAAAAWRDGNPTASTGLLRLARQIRRHARDTPPAAAAC